MNGAESVENAAARHSLLAELDAKQEEVLAALDKLNEQIESVLKQAVPQDKLAVEEPRIAKAA
jgi:hypothetical protein